MSNPPLLYCRICESLAQCDAFTPAELLEFTDDPRRHLARVDDVTGDARRSCADGAASRGVRRPSDVRGHRRSTGASRETPRCLRLPLGQDR